MAKIISLKDYFRDAPFYRLHEGLVGAVHKIKDESDIYAPGLWIAKSTQTLEIAFLRRHREMENILEPRTIEAARNCYIFKDICVQTNDAIVDYYLPIVIKSEEKTFEEWRAARDFDRAQGISFFKKYFDRGALIRFHIPCEEFHNQYEFDDDQYRKKKFQIKFAPEDAFIIMPHGPAEKVQKHMEVFLRGDELTIRPPTIFSGVNERMINGQPLSFYLEVAREVLKKKPDIFDFLTDMAACSTGLAVTAMSGSRGKIKNPYQSMAALYKEAQRILTLPGVQLTHDQRADFDAHFNDVRRRYDYFQNNLPIVI